MAPPEAPLWYGDVLLMLFQQTAFAGYGLLASAAFSRERPVRPEVFALAVAFRGSSC